MVRWYYRMLWKCATVPVIPDKIIGNPFSWVCLRVKIEYIVRYNVNLTKKKKLRFSSLTFNAFVILFYFINVLRRSYLSQSVTRDVQGLFKAILTSIFLRNSRHFKLNRRTKWLCLYDKGETRRDCKMISSSSILRVVFHRSRRNHILPSLEDFASSTCLQSRVKHFPDRSSSKIVGGKMESYYRGENDWFIGVLELARWSDLAINVKIERNTGRGTGRTYRDVRSTQISWRSLVLGRWKRRLRRYRRFTV